MNATASPPAGGRNYLIRTFKRGRRTFRPFRGSTMRSSRQCWPDGRSVLGQSPPARHGDQAAALFHDGGRRRDRGCRGLAVLVRVAVPVALAAMLSFAVAAVVNYLLTSRIVFRRQAALQGFGAFLMGALAGCVNAGVTIIAATKFGPVARTRQDIGCRPRLLRQFPDQPADRLSLSLPAEKTREHGMSCGRWPRKISRNAVYHAWLVPE